VAKATTAPVGKQRLDACRQLAATAVVIVAAVGRTQQTIPTLGILQVTSAGQCLHQRDCANHCLYAHAFSQVTNAASLSD
jgi:hypothetical protein